MQNTKTQIPLTNLSIQSIIAKITGSFTKTSHFIDINDGKVEKEKVKSRMHLHRMANSEQYMSPSFAAELRHLAGRD